MYEYCSCIHVCVSVECSAHRGQEKLSDILELELQMLVNCHVDAWSLSSRRAASALISEPAPQPWAVIFYGISETVNFFVILKVQCFSIPIDTLHISLVYS